MRLVLLGVLMLAFSSGPVGSGDPPDPATSPAVKATEEPQLEEFVPSVEVRADNEISFPVDI